MFTTLGGMGVTSGSTAAKMPSEDRPESPRHAHPVVEDLFKGQGRWVSESHDSYRAFPPQPRSPNAYPRSDVWAADAAVDRGLTGVHAARDPLSPAPRSASPRFSPPRRRVSPARTTFRTKSSNGSRGQPQVHVSRRGSVDIVFPSEQRPAAVPQPPLQLRQSPPRADWSVAAELDTATLRSLAEAAAAKAAAAQALPPAPAPAPRLTPYTLKATAAWSEDAMNGKGWESYMSASTSAALARLEADSAGGCSARGGFVYVKPVPFKRPGLVGYADVDRILYGTRTSLAETGVSVTAIDEARGRRGEVQGNLSSGGII